MAASPASNGELGVNWPSAASSTYTLFHSTDLNNNWTTLSKNLSDGSINVSTDTPPAFFTIGLSDNLGSFTEAIVHISIQSNVTVRHFIATEDTFSKGNIPDLDASAQSILELRQIKLEPAKEK